MPSTKQRIKPVEEGFLHPKHRTAYGIAVYEYLTKTGRRKYRLKCSHCGKNWTQLELPIPKKGKKK